MCVWVLRDMCTFEERLYVISSIWIRKCFCFSHFYAISVCFTGGRNIFNIILFLMCSLRAVMINYDLFSCSDALVRLFILHSYAYRTYFFIIIIPLIWSNWTVHYPGHGLPLSFGVSCKYTGYQLINLF